MSRNRISQCVGHVKRDGTETWSKFTLLLIPSMDVIEYQ